jgi:hypothetical protein
LLMLAHTTSEGDYIYTRKAGVLSSVPLLEGVAVEAAN